MTDYGVHWRCCGLTDTNGRCRRRGYLWIGFAWPLCRQHHVIREDLVSISREMVTFRDFEPMV